MEPCALAAAIFAFALTPVRRYCRLARYDPLIAAKRDPVGAGSTCVPTDWPLAPELSPSSVGPPKSKDCQPGRQTLGTTQRALAVHADHSCLLQALSL